MLPPISLSVALFFVSWTQKSPLFVDASSSTTSSTATSYIDIHLITSFSSTGSLENGYLFRVPASNAAFGGNLPKAPQWATHSALTGGDDDDDANNNNIIYPSHRLLLPPQSDMYLCNESLGQVSYKTSNHDALTDIFDPDTNLSGYEGNYILVPRGLCAFESKVRSAQRLGVAGVIVRNTLDSRYESSSSSSSNTAMAVEEEVSDIVWPVDQRDYECGNHYTHNQFGVRSEIDVMELDYYPPVPPSSSYGGESDNNNNNNRMNDNLLTGPGVDGNLCAKGMTSENGRMSSFEEHCPSLRCLLTGTNITTTTTTTKVEACCAWDILMPMGANGDGDDGDAVPEHEEEPINIPAIFVTMENGEELYDLVIDAMLNSENGGESVQFVSVVPYARWYPSGHLSSIFVFVLAVFTVWMASYISAKEYRDSWKEISLAVNDGVLVFGGMASLANGASDSTGGQGTRRRRADTDDTVDLDDEDADLRLASEVEMTTTGTSAAAREQSNGTTGNPAATTTATSSAVNDSTFTISDEAHEEDDFVANPTSPKPTDRSSTITSSNNTESITNNESSPEPTVGGGEVSTTGAVSHSPPQSTAQQQHQQLQSLPVNLQTQPTPASMRFMELNAFHVVLFAAVASFFLFVLFLFDLSRVVRFAYGICGSIAMTHLLLHPMLEKLSSNYFGEGISKKLQSNAFGNLPGCRGKYYKWMDVASSATGYAMGIAWIIVGFSYVQPLDNVYYWLIQDVMGVCFCIIILGVIHINRIMIATILLTIVFIYDVFYVFLSPYIFGRSVMMDVALGGAYGVDPTFCEKYPTDPSCRGSMAPLPMLLVIPWFNDFRGGFSFVGLGDIILPGLLISFAARYDAARALVKKCSRASSNQLSDSEGGENGRNNGRMSRLRHYLARARKALFRGYFGPLVIAYAIGLALAYLAVAMTKRGQPALVYLVPACLGTTLFLGWKRRELSELWSGPKVMRKADRMVGIADRIPVARAVAAREASANLAESSSVV